MILLNFPSDKFTYKNIIENLLIKNLIEKLMMIIRINIINVNLF